MTPEPSVDVLAAQVRAALEAANEDVYGPDGNKDAFAALVVLVGYAKRAERAAVIAEGLFQMIDPQTWRDSGGDDGQGHYEGDYRAEQIAAEIRSWRDG